MRCRARGAAMGAAGIHRDRPSIWDSGFSAHCLSHRVSSWVSLECPTHITRREKCLPAFSTLRPPRLISYRLSGYSLSPVYAFRLCCPCLPTLPIFLQSFWFCKAGLRVQEMLARRNYVAPFNSQSTVSIFFKAWASACPTGIQAALVAEVDISSLK